MDNKSIREEIAEIMRDNIKPFGDDYIIHGAIDKIIELFQNKQKPKEYYIRAIVENIAADARHKWDSYDIESSGISNYTNQIISVVSKPVQLKEPLIKDFNSNEWVRGDDDFKPNLTCKEIRSLLERAAKKEPVSNE